MTCAFIGFSVPSSRMQDRLELWAASTDQATSGHSKVKPSVLAEADDEDALAVLRHEVLASMTRVDVIAELPRSASDG